jgi:formylglycine-generating enzyme required for sulfatase activity
LGGGWSKVRLPSEAMWEYACRAGTETLWNVGNNLSPDDANFGQRFGRTRPVGEGTANAFGLYDMHGHVWEWVSDYAGNYSSDSQTDPEGPPSGSERVNRAGGWNSPAWLCRSAIRTFREAFSFSNQNVGFRLALVPSAKAK